MPKLHAQYLARLTQEGWSADTQQEQAIESLSRVLKQITAKKSWWPFSKTEPVKGAYLYGGVGRGKSMLMDLFYDTVPNKISKRRVHFHQFMIETHDWLHQNRGSEMDDLLPSYARHISAQMRLLCFDEFHVTDVADAMILGRLFTALFDQGVVVISTSNWAPDDLYEGGLQRDLFLPFIKFLKTRMEVVHLDSDTDYRTLADPDQDVYYFHPLDRDVQKKVDQLFSELTDGHKLGANILNIKGRNLEITAANDVARFTFTQLCEQPLGAEDYIKVAQSFDTVFVEDIPVLTPEKRNEAKRLILLIDCLYEAHCRLIISAAADIHHLYDGGDHAFEFDRTISRLMEMQSTAYHEKRLEKR